MSAVKDSVSKPSKKNFRCPFGPFAFSSSEILTDRLYFVVLKCQHYPYYSSDVHYFAIDEELRYEPFYEDFGPLNLAHLHLFCEKLEGKLSSPLYEKKKIVHYTSFEGKKRVNAAYLMGAYMVLYLNLSAEEAYGKLNPDNSVSFMEFRDASLGDAHFTISLIDCLSAVAKAKDSGFYNPKDFVLEEYLYFETVEHGDLNWIVPEKFLAFAGPKSPFYGDHNNTGHNPVGHTPESYLTYFKAMNVKTVVRLNNRCYDATKFTEAGIQHYDLIFVDGGIPSDDLVQTFLKIAEEAKGAIAVHCKAGLGRTGSMIACYLMKWYRFTAREAIAWLRICRPASIIGHQQHWLEAKQVEMWVAGMKLPRPKHLRGVYNSETGVYFCDKNNPRKGISSTSSLSGITTQVTSMNINEMKTDNSREPSQGDHLQKIKSTRANRLSWPLTNSRVSDTSHVLSSIRRAAVAANKVESKRKLTRKKVTSVSSAKTDASSTTLGSVSDSPCVPLRRSPRILEPRQCKSGILR